MKIPDEFEKRTSVFSVLSKHFVQIASIYHLSEYGVRSYHIQLCSPSVCYCTCQKKKKKSSLNIKKKGSQIEDYNPRAASQKVSELFCPLEEHSYIQIF